MPSILTTDDIETGRIYRTRYHGHVRVLAAKNRKHFGRWDHHVEIVKERTPKPTYGSYNVGTQMNVYTEELLVPCDENFQDDLTPKLVRRKNKIEAEKKRKEAKVAAARNWGEDAIRYLGASGIQSSVQAISVNSRPRKPHLCIPTEDLSTLVPMLEKLAEQNIKWLLADEEDLSGFDPVGDAVAELAEMVKQL